MFRNLQNEVFPDTGEFRALSESTEACWGRILSEIGFFSAPEFGVGHWVRNKWFGVHYSSVGISTSFFVIMGNPVEWIEGGCQRFSRWGTDRFDDPDTHDFLKALMEPELLPTLTGIPWAGDIIEVWLGGK